MTPAEAKEKYEAEWPALNAAKEEAMARGDTTAAKKCRQQLNRLSQKYKARHDLNRPDEAGECTRRGRTDMEVKAVAVERDIVEAAARLLSKALSAEGDVFGVDHNEATDVVGHLELLLEEMT